MLIRALDSAVDCVTLDTRIPLVPHDSKVPFHTHFETSTHVETHTRPHPTQIHTHTHQAPLALCRAVSALLNETHYMGRTATFVDSLSYLYNTTTALNAAGVKVNSLPRLISELKASGVVVLPRVPVRKASEVATARILTEGHLRLYWEWITVFGDKGIARLVELQNINAAELYEEIHTFAGPHPLAKRRAVLHEMKDLDQSHVGPAMPEPTWEWRGELGGFLPTLGTNYFHPSKSTKIFTPATTTEGAIAIVERG